MAANSNALVRHKTIDACLRDIQNKYTLKDLINACTQAIHEKNSKKKGAKRKVSLRTVQLDIQFMRDKKHGYGAPIVVFDHKYYKYKDPSYSIDKAGIKRDRLDNLYEVVEILKQYCSFSGFERIKNVVSILEEEVTAKISKRNPIISYEGKKNPLGLEYFDTIHDAILHRKVLCIGYYSSRSNNIMSILFYPMYLKEYKGRWYALGYKDGIKGVYKLPLDRIRDLSYAILPFPDDLEFHPAEYFKDIVGVTRLSGDAREIIFSVKNKLAQFIQINPLHSSQKLIERKENGDIVFCIQIIPNREFYNTIFEYQPHIQILSPKEIGVQVNAVITDIVAELPEYDKPEKQEEENTQNTWDDSINLFSNL